MIYITGDTHIPIDIRKLSSANFPKQKELTKSDYVIVCGDFGGIWDGSNEERYWLKWLESKNFTTLFVDGNHENHVMLVEQYKAEEYCGGKAHRIMPSIYHLMRGAVFILDGKKFFAMGGASSHDKIYRKENKSWWPQELPSEDEYQSAFNSLDTHNWMVDYIITHCAPDSIQDKLSSYYEHDKLTSFFEYSIKPNCSYRKWFFGHYHTDTAVDNKHICLYQNIIEIS